MDELPPVSGETKEEVHARSQIARAVFVAEYLVDLDGPRAAIAAGFSEKSAASKAGCLLCEPEVKAKVREGLEERKQACQLKAATVLNELGLLGFSSMGDFMSTDKDGDPYLDLSAATPEMLRTIKEFETDEYLEGRGENARQMKKVKIKLHDKIGPLRDIAKYLKLITDKMELTGPGGAPLQIAVTFEEAKQ